MTAATAVQCSDTGLSSGTCSNSCRQDFLLESPRSPGQHNESENESRDDNIDTPTSNENAIGEEGLDHLTPLPGSGSLAGSFPRPGTAGSDGSIGSEGAETVARQLKAVTISSSVRSSGMLADASSTAHSISDSFESLSGSYMHSHLGAGSFCGADTTPGRPSLLGTTPGGDDWVFIPPSMSAGIHGGRSRGDSLEDKPKDFDASPLANIASVSRVEEAAYEISDTVGFFPDEEAVSAAGRGCTKANAQTIEEILCESIVMACTGGEQFSPDCIAPDTDDYKKHLAASVSINDGRFIDYAPSIFASLRHHYGIATGDYIKSWEGKMIEFPTPGKGRSFFFQTEDNQFLLKRLTAAEFTFFCSYLDDYYRHHSEAGTSTFLSRFYGLHEVVGEGFLENSYYVVMGSAFDPDGIIDEVFDLKGSTINRFVTEEQRKLMEETSPGARVCWKDLDWGNRKLHLGAARDGFVNDLERDCEFLERLGIIDYSLLVGIKKGDESCSVADIDGEGEKYRVLRAEENAEKDEVYYLAIIDIMQSYDIRKRLETAYKTYVLWKEREGLSSVDPLFYSQRFLKFMKEISQCDGESSDG